MSGKPQDDRNQEATVYMGNLDERATDALVWELMLQAGPVVNVHLPKDRISMSHQGYGFCEFLTEGDADYACKIMNQIKLFGKPIRVNKASSDRKQLDIGANLFIGNLDPNVDERALFDTFSAFGTLVQPAKIARDTTTGASKGYGFLSYDSFEASDAAISSMDAQFLMNKPISVQYAFKKDSASERHGTPAERLLAASAKKHGVVVPQAPPPPSFGGAQGGMGAPTGANAYGPRGAFGAMAGMPGMQGGYGMPPPPPPPGFGAQQPYGAPQQGYGHIPPPPPGFGPPPQGFPQQNGQIMPPPPPPPGFGGYQIPQAQYGQAPPPPPPGFA